MPRQKQPPAPREPGRNAAQLAEKAISTFRAENPDAYQQLVEAFEGRSADLALLGYDKFHVAVEKGEVRIEPGVMRAGASTGRGAASPETLMAILRGEVTPLEAFFKGDLIARASSPELHQVYNYFVKFADTALRSKRMQELMREFEEMVKA